MSRLVQGRRNCGELKGTKKTEKVEKYMIEDKRYVEVETDRRWVKVAYTSEIDMKSEGTCDESDIRG